MGDFVFMLYIVSWRFLDEGWNMPLPLGRELMNT